MKWEVGDLIRYENDKRGTYGIAIIVDTYGYDNFDVNWLVAKGFEVNKNTIGITLSVKFCNESKAFAFVAV